MNASTKGLLRFALLMSGLVVLTAFTLQSNEQTFSDWSAPVNVSSSVNTADFEG